MFQWIKMSILHTVFQCIMLSTLHTMFQWIKLPPFHTMFQWIKPFIWLFRICQNQRTFIPSIYLRMNVCSCFLCICKNEGCQTVYTSVRMKGRSDFLGISKNTKFSDSLCISNMAECTDSLCIYNISGCPDSLCICNISGCPDSVYLYDGRMSRLSVYL